MTSKKAWALCTGPPPFQTIETLPASTPVPKATVTVFEMAKHPFPALMLAVDGVAIPAGKMVATPKPFRSAPPTPEIARLPTTPTALAGEPVVPASALDVCGVVDGARGPTMPPVPSVVLITRTGAGRGTTDSTGWKAPVLSDDHIPPVSSRTSSKPVGARRELKFGFPFVSPPAGRAN